MYGTYLKKITNIPWCQKAPRYAKVWGRVIVRSHTFAYAKKLFLDSNQSPIGHQGTTLPLRQGLSSNTNLLLVKIHVEPTK